MYRYRVSGTSKHIYYIFDDDDDVGDDDAGDDDDDYHFAKGVVFQASGQGCGKGPGVCDKTHADGAGVVPGQKADKEALSL